MKNAPISPIVSIDFKAPRYRIALDAKSNPIAGVYIDTAGRYWERPKINERRTWRRLNSTTAKAAQAEHFRRRDQLARHLAGEPGIPNPYAVAETKRTLEHIADLYLEANCPKARSTSARQAKALDEEIAMVKTLKTFFGKKLPDQIHLEDCNAYFKWRTPQMRKGFTGRRQIDRELVTLSNIFRFAIRHGRSTGVAANPIAHDRQRFQDSSEVKHCRDFQPRDADELHAIARLLFQDSETAVYGWQALFEAMIGQRTHEILHLRIDAADEFAPGFIRGKSLFLFRSKSQKGTYPFVRIHAALEKCLDSHRAWHAKNFPESPWFFPNPHNPIKPVDKDKLTKELARVCAALGIHKITSHGLRSYCVNVHRSNGLPDAEIALRIGHKTGGKLIVDVYGEIMENKIDWLPADPAWNTFEKAPAYIQTDLPL